MSNIYIQEPPTHGKVVLKTTVGEIEIELWSKECPLACRNFVQLCMEGYYDGTIFHRVIPEFIVQGGDPTGTGEGGDSIYGEPFKDEFHQRLRFNRRGLVAMANGGKDDNSSQFFFTLGACTELQKKHTIFGKVGGNTIYNMLPLGESELIDDRPVKPHKILSTEVILNPFDDIVPRARQKLIPTKDTKETSKAIKNYGLLSFGDEAEEEDEELSSAVKEMKSKPKSAHDIGDPYLSSKPVHKLDEKKMETNQSASSSSDSEQDQENEETMKQKTANIEDIKSKLKKTGIEEKPKQAPKVAESKDEKELKTQKLKDEIKQLKQELLSNEQAKREEEDKKKQVEARHEEQADIMRRYKEDVDKYSHLKSQNKKLVSAKENKTLELLNSFRERLFNAKNKTAPDESTATATTSAEEQAMANNDLDVILTHKFDLEEEIKQKVIDANIRDNDRYDIYDPRNPLNKRKREVGKEEKRSREKRKH